jgi:cysteine desulfurase
MNNQKQVYLDSNSTTRIHGKALQAMLFFLQHEYGNSASLHKKGRAASAALEQARETIAGLLGTEGVDIVFTSGGTESDNLAIKGVCFKNMASGRHIITSSVEHMAVLKTCNFLETQGFDVDYLQVDRYGMVDPVDIKKTIRDDTIFITVMHANNEVGTIQPIADIADIIRQENHSRALQNRHRIYFHTDAVQTFGKIPIDVDSLGVDLLSVSSHKIYGPKGMGALYIRKSTDISACNQGGHQERGIRPGTVDVAGAVGFAEAANIAHSNLRSQDRIRMLRDELHQGLLKKITGIKLNGHPETRLSNTLNLSFDGVDSTLFTANLDLKGICVSAGSACMSSVNEQSHVLQAMNAGQEPVRNSVRFSLGEDTSEEDILYCLEEIPGIVERIRYVHR